MKQNVPYFSKQKIAIFVQGFWFMADLDKEQQPN